MSCAPDPGSLQKTGLTSHLPGWNLLKIAQSTGLSTASEQPHGTWHTRITLPLFIKTKIFGIKHKIPVYFKPREYPSPPFHAFKAEEIITAYHFPSPHIKMLKNKVKRKWNPLSETMLLASNFLILDDGLCPGPWLLSVCILYLSRWLCAY